MIEWPYQGSRSDADGGSALDIVAETARKLDHRAVVLWTQRRDNHHSEDAS